MKMHIFRKRISSNTPRWLLIGMGCLLALLLITAAIHRFTPQPGMPRHDYTRLSDRLSSQQVKAFAESPEGYIMIGTEYGLNRFNGQNYTQYFSTTDSCSLPNNNIVEVRYLTHHPDWCMVTTFVGSCIVFPDGTASMLCPGGYRPPVELSDSLILGYYDNQLSLYALQMPSRQYRPIRSICLDGVVGQVIRQSDTSFWVNSGRDFKLYDVQFNYKGKSSVDADVSNVFTLDMLRTLLITDAGFSIMNTADGTIGSDPTCDFLNAQIPNPREALRVFLSGNVLAVKLREEAGLRLIDLEELTVSHATFDPIGATEIGAFLCDSHRNLWCGSRSSGYQTHFAGRTAFVDDGELCHHFAGKDITAIDRHPDGRLWVCTGRSDIALCDLGGKVTEMDMSQVGANYIMHIASRANGNLLISGIGHIYECRATDAGRLQLLHDLSTDNSIYAIDEDSQGRIWIGTQSGCHIIDLEANASTILDNNLRQVNNIEELHDGRILAGSYNSGISIFDPDTFAETHFDLPCEKEGMISCRDVAEDNEGGIWIATIGMGVFRLDLNTGEVRNFRAQNMCTDVSCIEVDRSTGNIWIGTLDGLSCLDPTTGRFQTYHANDGVQSNEFYERCATRCDDHTLVFGGKQGITIFDPSEIRPQVSRTLLVSNIEVNGSLLPPNIRQGGYLLDRNEGAVALTLPHDFHNLNIHLSTLDFDNSTGSAIFYRMEGVDEERIFTAKPVVSYHSLDPGCYTFEAWALDQNGQTVCHIAMPIVISQPWWMAWWLRWLVYPLFAALAIAYTSLLTSNYLRNRRRIKQSLREKAVIQRMSDANMRFFTNMAHEFRTPLTLISGALGLIDDHRLPEGERHAHHIISSNTGRMLRLVNQLLDFKKLEADMLKLNVQPYRVTNLIESIVEMFQNGFEEKQIELAVDIRSTNDLVWIDPDKYEKVLFNLLSNALKYTPTRGKVTLTVKPIESQDAARLAPLPDIPTDGRWLLTQVSDTGIGIPDQLMPYIFERYYQTPEGATHQNGSGIGLFFCRGLVELHHGAIRAIHNPDADCGTSFYFLLPIEKAAYKPDELSQAIAFEQAPKPKESVSVVTIDTPSPLPTDDHRPTVLVVDDDTEVLRFLRLILQPSYQVVTQSSAIEAIAWLSEATPDLIVSDVMMVGMDGYELCSRLKKDVTYCHLPIVLLTAKVSIEERIHGLNVGADAYVTKPFDPDYLKALIGSLLDNRVRLRHLLTSSTSVRDVRVEPLQEEGVEVNPEIKDVAETAILEQDSVFMTRLYAFMEEHISDAELDLPQLLDVVAMSRSKLYYKMQSLVGQSPNAFFRTYRLNRAAEMIREGKEKIAYIGQLTGFSSSSHFAASFKKQFGVLPSEYKG